MIPGRTQMSADIVIGRYRMRSNPSPLLSRRIGWKTHAAMSLGRYSSSQESVFRLKGMESWMGDIR